MTLRPVGHITDNIRELARWRDNRIKCSARRVDKRKPPLEIKALETAIAYLTEYRELTREVAADLREQRRQEDTGE